MPAARMPGSTMCGWTCQSCRRRASCASGLWYGRPSLRAARACGTPFTPLESTMRLGQILVGGEIVHKGQGQAAKAFDILPVTPGAIERVMAPDELRPVRRGLALMGRKRLEFLRPDRADINVPLGLKDPATPQGPIRVTRPDLGERPATGVDVPQPVGHCIVHERLDDQSYAGHVVGVGILEPMRQHQVWGARQEEGREALDIRRDIAGDLHIGEAQARKLGPEALGPRGPLLPTLRIECIRDTTDRDAVTTLSVLVEGPTSEDFSIIGVRQNRHHACHARASKTLILSSLPGCAPDTAPRLTSCSVPRHPLS